jgi:putative transposase
MSILTFKFRVKDKAARKRLRNIAFGVNQIWNYCCAAQRHAERNWQAGAPKEACFWPTHYDLNKATAGTTKELGIHSDTLQWTCKQFAVARDKARHAPRFRASGGPKRALGWIPFIPRSVNVDGGTFTYLGRTYHFWKHRDMPAQFVTGQIVEDSTGRWYVCFQCEVPDDLPKGEGEVGIDLGLKTLATLSTGEKIDGVKPFRALEQKLAVAQRAGNKVRVKAIHAKIKNTRKHFLHGVSAKIARENALIVVGDVSASKLAKTRMAKSVLDAGWSMLRNQLAYKARRHQADYIKADERWTSQACSGCGSIGGPKGLKDLGVRTWICESCGCEHDRDLNSALLILRSGRNIALQLTESPTLMGGDDVTPAPLA